MAVNMEVPKKITVSYEDPETNRDMKLDYLLPTAVIDCYKELETKYERLLKDSASQTSRLLLGSNKYAGRILEVEHNYSVLESKFCAAISFLKEAKNKISPHTTNSDVDELIKWWENKGEK